MSRADIGPRVDERVPVLQPLVNAGLLHDDFTEPHRVGVRRFSPGQRSLVGSVPRNE